MKNPPNAQASGGNNQAIVDPNKTPDPNANLNPDNQEIDEEEEELDPAALLAQLKKTSQEAKKYRQSASSVRQELDELKRKLAEKDGDWQKVAEERAKEVIAEKGKTTKLLNSFGTRLVQEALEKEATKMGCTDLEIMTALVDGSEIEVDEDLKVDSTLVKAKLEELRKRKPALFKKANPTIHDVDPSKVVQTGKKKIEQMSVAELEAAIARLG